MSRHALLGFAEALPRGIIYDVERRDAILVWNPRAGYSCSACSWTKRVHVQDRLPEEDELAQKVREEFAGSRSRKAFSKARRSCLSARSRGMEGASTSHCL